MNKQENAGLISYLYIEQMLLVNWYNEESYSITM